MAKTHYLNRKLLSSIKNAPRTAEVLGRPLNVLVTIAAYQTNVPKHEIFERFLLLKNRKLGGWSRYKPKGKSRGKNGPLTLAWVREAPGGNEHIHLALHVEPQNMAEFKIKMARWVRDTFGDADWSDQVLDIKDIYRANGVATYMCKGADPHIASFYYIKESYLKDQGVVIGRRGGVSANLGVSVRKGMRKNGDYSRRLLPKAA